MGTEADKAAGTGEGKEEGTVWGTGADKGEGRAAGTEAGKGEGKAVGTGAAACSPTLAPLPGIHRGDPWPWFGTVLPTLGCTRKCRTFAAFGRDTA